MTAEDQLLARLGKQIDLPAYLASKGYQYSGANRGDGSAAGLVVGIIMRAGETTPALCPDVLVLARDPEHGGWTYTDGRSSLNRGTVVEHLQRHEQLSRRDTIERLAACLDRNRRDPEAEHYRGCVADKPLSLRRTENEHAVYTQHHRDVTAELARRGVLVETHIDQFGPRTLVAAVANRFEPIKTQADFVRLTEEPAKIWTTRFKATDKELVLVERGIDAVAHAQKHRNPNVCYVAVGSELTLDRKTQLSHLLAAVPSGVTVVAAFGRDERGRGLADQIDRLAQHRPVTREVPPFGATWSEQMQLEERHSRSMGLGQQAGVTR